MFSLHLHNLDFRTLAKNFMSYIDHILSYFISYSNRLDKVRITQNYGLTSIGFEKITDKDLNIWYKI